MPNGWLANGLWTVEPSGSVQGFPGSGSGDARLTSFCSRHWSFLPVVSTWVLRGVLPGFLLSPSTPGQLPKRLSKLWFSS